MLIARLVDAIQFELAETLEFEVDTVLLFELKLTDTEIVVAFVAEFTAVKLATLAVSIGIEEKVEELAIIESDLVVCASARAKETEEDDMRRTREARVMRMYALISLPKPVARMQITACS